MKAIWFTDLHLNFLTARQITAFLETAAASPAEVMLISGDISDAPPLTRYLRQIEEQVQRPIYFVLGNHDFYHGSIAEVRARVMQLSKENPRLTWLGNAGVVELTPRTALIGHDGWGDARYGTPARALLLNDEFQIRELMNLASAELRARLKQLGEESAAYLESVLPTALARYEHIYVLTHVPPFIEACRYMGQISSDEALPRFACKSVGEVLWRAMQAHPARQMTVLCGHTHEGADVAILPNLRVLAGKTDYGITPIQGVFKIL